MQTAAVQTLHSGSLTVPYMTMTLDVLDCTAPVLPKDFTACGVPGGVELWSSDGFYSPGQCFSGYGAQCTQSTPKWPLVEGETAVRCVPSGYDCNAPSEDQKYAVSEYDGTTLSAPAFEIRWRSEDLLSGGKPRSSSFVTSQESGNNEPVITTTTTTTTTSGILSGGGGQVTTSSSLEGSSSNVVSTFSPEPTESNKEESGSSSSPLSSSSIKGLVVGVLLGVIGIALLSFFFVFRHRRARRASQSSSSSPRQTAAFTPQSPPLLGSERMTQVIPAELDDGARSEAKELAADSSKDAKDGNVSRSTATGYVKMNNAPIELPAGSVPRSATGTV